MNIVTLSGDRPVNLDNVESIVLYSDAIHIQWVHRDMPAIFNETTDDDDAQIQLGLAGGPYVQLYDPDSEAPAWVLLDRWDYLSLEGYRVEIFYSHRTAGVVWSASSRELGHIRAELNRRR